MDETKTRKPRSDKGIKRTQVSDGPPIDNAPIHVVVHLKNGITEEFGCANHTVENGFHVFIYPSKRDPYRETRHEFAISEIISIEVTAPRPVYEFREMKVPMGPPPVHREEAPPEEFGKPKIHSVRKNLTAKGMGNDVVSRLETSSGPIKMTEADLAGALGVGTTVAGIGDSNQ
jgi:hypothetical protein